jgi:hypothetical protein
MKDSVETRYPLLAYVMGSALDNQVAEYINLIDKQEI